MTHVAIIGCGFVGGSWAAVFARAGIDVVLYDPSAASIETAHNLARLHLLDRKQPECVKRLRVAASLEEAVKDSFYVQESSPERLEIKQPIYTEMGKFTSGETILASSTSGFPASSLSDDPSVQRRCIVSHPINPPHLIPLVEIVPSPKTQPDVIRRTDELMRRVGQVPIHLNREINGFVVNRLQSAVLAEAFKLVEDGVASVADIDLAMSDGLALRWFFMGPFETIDLNAMGGIADYCSKLGSMYFGLAKEQAEARLWSDALIGEVEAQRRKLLALEGLEGRRAWRDKCLARLLKAKDQMLGLEELD